MATVSVPFSAGHGPARTITRIAADYGLHRSEVRTLIAEHAVPTQAIGRARVVMPADWHRLEPVLRRYREAKGYAAPG